MCVAAVSFLLPMTTSSSFVLLCSFSCLVHSNYKLLASSCVLPVKSVTTSVLTLTHTHSHRTIYSFFYYLFCHYMYPIAHTDMHVYVYYINVFFSFVLSKWLCVYYMVLVRSLHERTSHRTQVTPIQIVNLFRAQCIHCDDEKEHAVQTELKWSGDAVTIFVIVLSKSAWCMLLLLYLSLSDSFLVSHCSLWLELCFIYFTLV